jgi:cytochrome c biogenesis protein CcmG, thiol:disulfide interchange protein DsbE
VAEAAQLDKFYREEAKRGEVLVVAVNDSAANMQELLRSGNYEFPVMQDPSAGIAQRYGVRAVPTVFVIDGTGTIRASRVGGLTTSELISLTDDASR